MIIYSPDLIDLSCIAPTFKKGIANSISIDLIYILTDQFIWLIPYQTLKASSTP